MKFTARIEVGLKPGHSDPEGETTKECLLELNYFVSLVKVSKIFEVHFKSSSFEEAEAKITEMCKRLLANPVKDDYTFQIEERE